MRATRKDAQGRPAEGVKMQNHGRESTPPAQADISNDARALHAWLLSDCAYWYRDSTRRARILQYGPSATRTARALDAALGELAAAGHIRIGTKGNRPLIIVRTQPESANKN